MAPIRAKEHAEHQDFEKDVESRYHVIYGAEMAVPLPPPNWLCKGLGIAPGGPFTLGGAGFGGKTMAAQALAMAVATGTPLWGHFPVRQGAVLHLDWEQDDLTVRRYQRMARSMSIDLAELGRMLGSSLLPNAWLDDPGGERALAHLCQGKALCIIDSFRGAFKKAQENDSSVYEYLAMLLRVSKATGCVILIIAHARKMSDDKDVRSSLRGSAAIFDASASVLMLTGTKGKPALATHTKSKHSGEQLDDFGLRIIDEQGPRTASSDCEGDIDPKWGLAVEYVSGPEMQVEYSQPDRDDNSLAINAARIESLGLRMLHIITASSDGIPMATLKGMLSGERVGDILAAMPMLVQTRAVIVDGTGTNTVYRANETREPGVD